MVLDRCCNCGLADDLKACSRCHGATGVYCSKDCQAAHWKVHKPICRPLEDGQVWGIKILDNRYSPWSRQFQHFLFDSSHPIFLLGELCPVTAKCGFPLLVYSDSIHGGLPAYQNNQPAVYLRIEPYDGFAPDHWQVYPAETCYVVRQDRKPLTKEALEIVYNFHSHLLDIVQIEMIDYGNGPWQEPVSPRWLLRFADKYRKDERARGRKGFEFFP